MPGIFWYIHYLIQLLCYVTYQFLFWTYLLTFKLIWVLSFYCNHVDKKIYICRFSDSILANILAVKQDLCRKPFDLKIDDVRFVGYPMSLDPSKSKPGAHQIISFNITFVLRVCVKYFTHFSILSCDVYFIEGNFCIRFCLLPTLFFKSAYFPIVNKHFVDILEQKISLAFWWVVDLIAHVVEICQECIYHCCVWVFV